MGADARGARLGVSRSVSGAAAGLHVALIWGALVNRALVLQRRLVFARPVVTFAAVLNTIEEVDGKAWRNEEEQQVSDEPKNWK